MGIFSSLFGGGTEKKIVEATGFMSGFLDAEKRYIEYFFDYRKLTVDSKCNTEDLGHETDSFKRVIRFLEYEIHYIYNLYLKKSGRQFGFYNDEYEYTERLTDLFRVGRTVAYEETMRYSFYEGDQLKSYNGDQILQKQIEAQLEIICSISEKEFPYFEKITLPERTNSDYDTQKLYMGHILGVCEEIKGKCVEVMSQIKEEEALFRIGLLEILIDIVYYLSQSISMNLSGMSMIGKSVAVETKYVMGFLKLLKLRSEEFLFLSMTEDMFTEEFYSHFKELNDYDKSYQFMQYKMQNLSKSVK